MRRALYVVGALVFVLVGYTLVFSDVAIRTERNGVKTVNITSGTSATQQVSTSSYVLIGWNDLGMHCISPRFKEMSILPPYNNLMVQVIRKGDPPKIITSGVTLEYSIINNTTVKGKTDFWQYVKKLFGAALPQGTGLTGNGLSGKMKAVGDHFEATGIPILPYDDKMVWNPYQRAIVKMKDTYGKVIASTEVVIPVSDELHCEKCHANGGIAAIGINTGTLEGNILTLHDLKNGTHLMAQRPVLCASCHSDNALGMAGTPGVSSLSLAMHNRHASLGANTPGCYDCHPGSKTQCNRSAIDGMGPVGNDPQCETCHGTLQQLSDSLHKGRNPWLEEPTCEQCHGAKYSTGKNLYRNSAGHGGVRCSACHNSPHAWWPSKNPLDNTQPINLQGSAGPIGHCQVCHKTNPGSGSPHDASGHPAGWRDQHGDYVEHNGTTSCQSCHGVNLTGGAGPSCYSCHGNEWSE